MMDGKVILIFLLFPGFIYGHCHRHRDCQTCTGHQTWSGEPCRWCPLGNSCHAKWSFSNHCLWEQNIVNSTLCPKRASETVDNRSTYNATKAYKMALFSAVAYSDTPRNCLAKMFPTRNFTDMFVYKQDCDDYLFDYDKQCLAFVVADHDEGEIIVSYRGTKGTKQIFEQILTIIGTSAVDSDVGGQVQRYFKNVHDKLYQGIKIHVRKLLIRFPSYNLTFTGHSLGGAAASIAAASLVKQRIVRKDKLVFYSYGMPRVGNKEYAHIHDKLVPHSWRVVRQADFVTKFPICRYGRCAGGNGPYHHKTKVIYTDSNMNINSSYVVCNGNEDSHSQCKTRGRTRHKRGVFTGAINDHKVYFGIPIGTYCMNHVLNETQDVTTVSVHLH